MSARVTTEQARAWLAGMAEFRACEGCGVRSPPEMTIDGDPYHRGCLVAISSIYGHSPVRVMASGVPRAQSMALAADLIDAREALDADAETYRASADILTEERDTQRARAEAAEAEAARLRAASRAAAQAIVEELGADGPMDVGDAVRKALARIDAVTCDRDALRTDVARLRAIVEGRTTAPTDAEIDAHYRAGGGWIYSRPEGVRASVVAQPMTARTIIYAAACQRETLRWMAVDANSRPTAWPVVEAPAPDLCECGHPVEMHRGADRCGAHGCGCDRNAEEASWR